MILPFINADYLWFTMPLTESIVAVFAIAAMMHFNKNLSVKGR